LTFESFADLRSIFREDAREAYLALVERRPGEHICAFALVTDDDALGAHGVGDTIERRKKRLGAREPRNDAERRYHDWEFGWNTGEWDEIYSEEHPRTEAPGIGAKEYLTGMMSFQERWSSQEGHSEGMFRPNSLRAMVDALADLDGEGLFGKGLARDAITLFVEITDSDDSDAAKLATARMLNPPKAAQALTRSLPWSGRLIVTAMEVVGWFRRGRIIALRSA